MAMNPRLLRPRATNYTFVDADARTYAFAVEAADGRQLEYNVRKAIDDFVRGCKTDGIWSAIKASCILMGARTLSGALTPLVGSAPTNNGPFVSGDYNRKTGLVGNGSTKYLDSNRNNNADPQDSVHHSVWFSSVNTVDGIPIGAGFNLTGATRCGVVPSASSISVRNRSSSVQAITPTPSFPTNGTFFGCSRSSSSLTTLRSNGSNGTNASASQTPFNGDVFVFCDNNAGTATAFVDARLAFYSIGESLNLALLDSRVSTLYIAIGAAVSPNYADADVNAYINAVEAADGQLLETGVRDAINDFIVGCKSDGTWSAIKASCILMGARTLSGALTPLVGTAPTNNNFVSGDYNRKTGLVGNGTTKYLNSNRNNNADPQNSKHMAFYSSTAGTAGISIGCGAGSDTGRSVWVRFSADPASNPTRLNCGTGTNVGNSTETGFLGLSRSAAGSYSARLSGSSQTVSQNSETPQNENIGVFARSTGASFNNDRIAYYSIGESLNLALLDSRVSTLYTAIGAAIP